MIPALIKNKYPESFTIGIMTASPNLGIIIPPSISMILYCMISNVSLEGLFLTGFLPGIGIMLLHLHLHVLRSKRQQGDSQGSSADSQARVGHFQGVLLGPHAAGGHFCRNLFRAYTANEAAVVASVYAFLVELFIHKSMKWKQVFRITANSAMTSGTFSSSWPEPRASPVPDRGHDPRSGDGVGAPVH